MSLATTSEKGVDDDWVLNSGCKYYMCLYRDWLVTYEPVDTRIVLIGNDIECKVAGIGTVQIKPMMAWLGHCLKFDTFLI